MLRTLVEFALVSEFVKLQRRDRLKMTKKEVGVGTMNMKKNNTSW